MDSACDVTDRPTGESPQWAMKVAALARRAAVVAFGYAMAVGTATIVTVAHMTLPTVLPDDGAMGSLSGQMRELPGFLMGGLMITSYAALPGFLAVVALAARYGWHDWPRFMAAGALNVFPALWLFGGFGVLGGGDAFFTFCCLGGGLAGGFAYWLAAEYPRRMSTAPARSGS